MNAWKLNLAFLIFDAVDMAWQSKLRKRQGLEIAEDGYGLITFVNVCCSEDIYAAIDIAEDMYAAIDIAEDMYATIDIAEDNLHDNKMILVA